MPPPLPLLPLGSRQCALSRDLQDLHPTLQPQQPPISSWHPPARVRTYGAGSEGGGDGPGSGRRKWPFCVPPIPLRCIPRAVPGTPANSTARAETPILHATYLAQTELSAPPVAFLSFLPPSPSSSCWLPSGALALASGSSSSPGWLSLRAHGCPPAASAEVVGRGLSVGEEWSPKCRACSPSGAGWRWQSVRLGLLRSLRALHKSHARNSLRCTRLERGASRRGGRGPAQRCRERGRAEKEERNREERN